MTSQADGQAFRVGYSQKRSIHNVLVKKNESRERLASGDLCFPGSGAKAVDDRFPCFYAIRHRLTSDCPLAKSLWISKTMGTGGGYTLTTRPPDPSSMDTQARCALACHIVLRAEPICPSVERQVDQSYSYSDSTCTVSLGSLCVAGWETVRCTPV